jgi:hypothetical protein
VTRLLDGRHHLERFAMEQAGEVDYLITWRDEFVGRVSPEPMPGPLHDTVPAPGTARRSDAGVVQRHVTFGIRP